MANENRSSPKCGTSVRRTLASQLDLAQFGTELFSHDLFGGGLGHDVEPQLSRLADVFQSLFLSLTLGITTFQGGNAHRTSAHRFGPDQHF
jgi:hypothetical protein